MKLEDIISLWEEDTNIDRKDIGEEALKLSKLHQKYYQIYIHEKLVLRQYQAQYKSLELEKYEFYTQGPQSKEQLDKGWKIPASGKILKSEVKPYLEADPDLIKLSLRIGKQNEKCDYLDSILKSLNNRGYNLKLFLEWEKFKMGM